MPGVVPPPRSAKGSVQRLFAREGRLFFRVQIASFAATLVDAATYQLVLRAGGYRGAALAGAIAGALTNFTLNRSWAFPPSGRSLRAQIAMYAAASLLTFLGLQAGLFTLIELLHVKPRLAWLPAKGFAWLGISYPLFRYVVFARRPPRERHGLPTDGASRCSQRRGRPGARRSIEPPDDRFRG